MKKIRCSVRTQKTLPECPRSRRRRKCKTNLILQAPATPFRLPCCRKNASQLQPACAVVHVQTLRLLCVRLALYDHCCHCCSKKLLLPGDLLLMLKQTQQVKVLSWSSQASSLLLPSAALHLHCSRHCPKLLARLLVPASAVAAAARRLSELKKQPRDTLLLQGPPARFFA